MTAPSPVLLRAGELQSFVEVPLARGSTHWTIEVQDLLFETPGAKPQRGLVVKVQHWSGAIDLYHDPHLPIDAEWFSNDPAYAHGTLDSITPIDLSEASYRTDSKVTSVDLEIVDRHGTSIRVVVEHKASRNAKPLFVPTPISGAPHPPNLRLLHMTGFRCLPRRGSTVRVEVDGVVQENAPLLLPASIAPLWSARSCDQCLLVAVNDGGDASSTVQTSAGHFSVRYDGAFTPQGPDGQAGSFTIDSPIGTVSSGCWTARSSGGEWSFELSEVQQHWSPGLRRPVAHVLSVLRQFRRRNQSWSWVGADRPGTAAARRNQGVWSN